MVISSVGVCFCGVSVVYSNVFKILSSFIFTFIQLKLERKYPKSMDMRVEFNQNLCFFSHCFVWFSKQIETDVTLRLYVYELSILSFSAVYCMCLLVCVLCLRSYLCYCFLLLLRSLFVGRGELLTNNYLFI